MSASSPRFGDLLQELGLVTPRQLEEALALQSLSGQRVGEALVSLGHVTREQLLVVLLEALGLDPGATAHRPQLGALLVGLEYLSPAQLEDALAHQQQDGRKLGELLVALGHCTYQQVYEALGIQGQVAGVRASQTLDGRGALAVPAAGPARRRVMVVDDSPLACAVVQSGLEGLGYEVVCFEDPFQGLAQVGRVAPSIVVTDLDMPGLDGVELCRRLKDGPARSVPVIILTANDAEGERVRGLRAGADDYVNKLASMDELAARIESVVRRTDETERMRKLFARYTSDAVVEEILKSGEEVVLTGEKREVTVLFADLRNFTGLAESLPPEQTVGVLNAVLGRLADAVLTCGGTLDKFLGDGLMAVFGAPVTREDDPLRALQAAKMMMASMQGMRAPGEGAPLLQLGVGVNSGPVVVGNIGSAQRTEYTCIGDAVNVAARLCALAGPGEILVGERTRELVAQQHGDPGWLEALPPVRLKGKAQPVPLYRAV